LFFNAFWLIPHFCINLMYIRDTMHQIDSGVIVSFLKAILRKFRERVELPLGMAGAAAKKLTKRLQMLLGKKTSASEHIMHGAHSCMVPVNYATTNIFKQLADKQRLLGARVPVTIAICCCFFRSYCPTCFVTRWHNITVITDNNLLSIRQRSLLVFPICFCVGTSCFG
jgi:hypothetical protein